MSASTPFKKYTESGIAPLLNLLGLFTTAIIVLSLISFVYLLIVQFISFIYFNVIVLFAFAYAIGHISRYLNITFKIRHKKVSILITGLISLIAIYVQWALFIYMYSVDYPAPIDDFSYILEIISSPNIVIDSIIEINEYGTWEMKSSVINGSTLSFIWALEALIIIAVPLRVYSQFDVLPFSEKDNRWYKKRKIDKEFEYISLQKDFLKSFYENPLDSLNSLDKPNPNRFSNVYIYSDKNKRNYLIEIENVKVNSKSKKEYLEVLFPSHIGINEVKKLEANFKII